MTGKQHLIVGGATGIVVAGAVTYLNMKTSLNIDSVSTSTVDSVLIIGGALFGSILPDLDSGKSKINQYFNKAIIATIILIILGKLIDIPIITDLVHVIARNNFIVTHFGESAYTFLILVFCGLCALGRMSPHREFTHKWLGTLAFLVCGYFLFPFVLFLGYALGYLSHCVADKTTVAGSRYHFVDLKLPCQRANGEIDFDGGIRKLMNSFKAGTPLASVGNHHHKGNGNNYTKPQK